MWKYPRRSIHQCNLKDQRKCVNVGATHGRRLGEFEGLRGAPGFACTFRKMRLAKIQQWSPGSVPCDLVMSLFEFIPLCLCPGMAIFKPLSGR